MARLPSMGDWTRWPWPHPNRMSIGTLNLGDYYLVAELFEAKIRQCKGYSCAGKYRSPELRVHCLFISRTPESGRSRLSFALPDGLIPLGRRVCADRIMQSLARVCQLIIQRELWMNECNWLPQQMLLPATQCVSGLAAESQE